MTVCASAAGAEIWGRIVALGEVVADVYREEMPSAVELSFTDRDRRVHEPSQPPS